jgi:hypothetical protein
MSKVIKIQVGIPAEQYEIPFRKELGYGGEFYLDSIDEGWSIKLVYEYDEYNYKDAQISELAIHNPPIRWIHPAWPEYGGDDRDHIPVTIYGEEQ